MSIVAMTLDSFALPPRNAYEIQSRQLTKTADQPAKILKLIAFQPLTDAPTKTDCLALNGADCWQMLRLSLPMNPGALSKCCRKVASQMLVIASARDTVAYACEIA
jgi:hypothetical protein